MASLRALSSKKHAGLAWLPQLPPRVVEGQKTVALAMNEVTPFSTRLPYLFEKKGREARAVVPLDVLEANGSALVNDEGIWRTPTIPFDLLRGPFRAMPQDDGTLIAVDERALVPLAEDGAEGAAKPVPLFDENGALTEITQAHVEHLTVWRAGVDAVSAAATALTQAGVLRFLDFDGKDRYGIVDEERLNNLSKTQAGELHAVGALKLAYGSIASLSILNAIKKVNVKQKSDTTDTEAEDFLAILREGFE